MKKLLITGAAGVLGARAAAYYAARYDVTAVGHGALDITDAAACAALLDALRPAYVLHCAAISDTGAARQCPALSQAVNVDGTRKLARACAATGAKLVYMSSDQVYAGCGGALPLCETAAQCPPENVYGTQKRAAECAAAEECPDAVGLRLTWMYDADENGFPRHADVFAQLARAAAGGEPLRASRREMRGLTNVWDVVTRLEACFALPGGVYNFGSAATANSYETLLAAARAYRAGPGRTTAPEAEALVVPHSDWARNLSMDTAKMQTYGVCFPDTIAGFAAAGPLWQTLKKSL